MIRVDGEGGRGGSGMRMHSFIHPLSYTQHVPQPVAPGPWTREEGRLLATWSQRWRRRRTKDGGAGVVGIVVVVVEGVMMLC